jgi:riboflavin synthase
LFTGIVQALGRVERLERRGEAAALDVETSALSSEALAAGESVCVSGACLTAARVLPGRTVFDVSAETLRRTTLGSLRAGAKVNLERALALGDRMGGHLMAGHVDGLAECVRLERVGAGSEAVFRGPAELSRFLAEKGSVALDGVSLTIARLEEGGRAFRAALVPHTLRATTLGALRAGARVNLEVDLLARYVARLLESGGASASDGRLSEGFLRDHGFG